jgi:hypothetical protein
VDESPRDRQEREIEAARASYLHKRERQSERVVRPPARLRMKAEKVAPLVVWVDTPEGPVALEPPL